MKLRFLIFGDSGYHYVRKFGNLTVRINFFAAALYVLFMCLLAAGGE